MQQYPRPALCRASENRPKRDKAPADPDPPDHEPKPSGTGAVV
jgi:hypothetical protein